MHVSQILVMLCARRRLHSYVLAEHGDQRLRERVAENQLRAHDQNLHYDDQGVMPSHVGVY